MGRHDLKNSSNPLHPAAADKVYDFSLGNPSIPAPESVKKAILELMEQPPEEVHAYSPAPKAQESF